MRDLCSGDCLTLTHRLQGLQAMDNSHVALVTVQLEANEFDSYRCDRNMPLGVNVSFARHPADRL